MALKIRLRQQGRSNNHVFRLVVIDSRQARDGKYLEALGWYNPRTRQEDLLISLKADRIQHWLNLGAEISENAESLIAKNAPEVLRSHAEKAIAGKLKQTAKKRERRRARKAQAVKA